MTSWVVVEVGCLECGEETHVLGVYGDEAEAKSRFVEAVAVEQADHRPEYRWQPNWEKALRLRARRGGTEVEAVTTKGGSANLQLHRVEVPRESGRRAA